jgi:hypothetical protein
LRAPDIAVRAEEDARRIAKNFAPEFFGDVAWEYRRERRLFVVTINLDEVWDMEVLADHGRRCGPGLFLQIARSNEFDRGFQRLASSGRIITIRLPQPLLSLAAKLCNSAGVMPKLNIVPINYFEGAFLCSFVVGAGEVDFFNAVAVAANKICLIVRHNRRSSHTGGLRSLLSQPRRLEFMGSFEIINLRT